MVWLQHLDERLFRLINSGCSHPWLDPVMPWFSGNALFMPAVVLLAIGLLWKGGLRGRCFVLVLAAALALGDSLIINTLKHALQRPRPFMVLPDVHLLAGRGSSFSMPSSHASTWFAATMLAFVYYRRSWRFMLPIACLVGCSRIYLGVHYPSDVAAGAVLGAGYAAAVAVALQSLWSTFGPRWFPLWHARCRNLLNPGTPRKAGPDLPPEPPSTPGTAATAALEQRQWRSLAALFVAVLFVLRLVYLHAAIIDLSEDEAYQWTWSKHLALSYYSKPPMIALLQWTGTHLWGDTELGVRFMSPVLAAALALVLFRFVERQLGSRTAFVVVVLAAVTPLLTVGSTLLTVDPPLVFFWTCAMVAGWRALQSDGATRHWLLVGLCAGLAFLSKYSALYLVVCFALFFALYPPARAHLRRPGPWLALLIIGLCTVPVLIWNASHGWITVHHVATNAGLHRAWKPTLRFFVEFLGAELALLNPVLLGAAALAAWRLWPRRLQEPWLLLVACMGVPVFGAHLVYSLFTRVQPNWIAPSVLPLVLLAVGYWAPLWAAPRSPLRRWCLLGLCLNLLLVAVMHDSRVLKRLAGHQLPLDADPLRRARGWPATARVVESALTRFEQPGKPLFVVAGHYGMVGELSFYLPAARLAVSSHPLVFHVTTESPVNQYYFWPGYQHLRPGQDALYVRELDPRKRTAAELWSALRQGELSVPSPKGGEEPPPEVLCREFETVTPLGIEPVPWRGHTIRWIQLFACRGRR